MATKIANCHDAKLMRPRLCWWDIYTPGRSGIVPCLVARVSHQRCLDAGLCSFAERDLDTKPDRTQNAGDDDRNDCLEGVTLHAAEMMRPSPGVSILSLNGLKPLASRSEAILLSISRLEDCASVRCASWMHTASVPRSAWQFSTSNSPQKCDLPDPRPPYTPL